MATDTVHSSRQSLVAGAKPKPKKSKKPAHRSTQLADLQAKGSSIGFLKKRIRDITRRLEGVENLPATVRVEDERALAAYQEKLQAALEEKTKKKIISKYHMVRFFERQKAERRLKKLKKSLQAAESPEETESLKKQVHIAEVDLNYTTHSPLLKPYIAIFRENDKAGESKKPEMWYEVERAMEAGTLRQLRDSVGLTVKVPTAAVKKAKKAKSKSEETKRGTSKAGKSDAPKSSTKMDVDDHEGNEDDGEDSDGGFFE